MTLADKAITGITATPRTHSPTSAGLRSSLINAARLIAVIGLVLTGGQALAADPLTQGFAQPPNDAKPWTFWWFQGGYGDPQGMARDIAAMKEKGVGGVMHMQTMNAGGLPVPQEPKMLGPEWDAWFSEALRLAHEAGLTMSASIVDGWAHGGGWVGKEDGAKQLVYAETQIDGPGSLTEPLPTPFTRIGVYHDVAVVAFKEQPTRPPAPVEVSANNVAGGYCGQEYWPAIHAADLDPDTFWKTASPCSAAAPACLNLTYARPITVTGALIAGMPKAGAAECELQVSDDGKAFRSVARITLSPGEQKLVKYDAVTGRHFRLSISRAHTPDLQLAEFQLLRPGDEPLLRPGIKCWDLKSANFGGGWGGWPKDLYQALEEEYAGDEVSDVSASDVVELSSHLQTDGRLDWQFPTGRWTVLRFGWTPIAAPARMGNGGGYEVDVLNTKGADLMMDNAAKRMRELSIKTAGGAPILFHTDSWEIGADNKGQQPTWTDDFRQQFQTRRGYDLLGYLPAMARRVVNDRETTDRFLCDYRRTVADLLAAYYGRLQERAHQMNGGMNSESGYGSFPHPHMDGLELFGRSDRPMAEFWHPYPMWSREYLEQVDVMRTAASGARIYGNRFVQAETLTYNPTAGQFTPPSQYRRTLHEAWARGLNQAVIHKYTHQPSEAKPGLQDYDIFNRHMAWWPLADGFLGYMGRCQYLLQQGDFVADAAYFVGEGASRFVPGKESLRPALPSGYDYDGINAEVLLNRASVKRGQLVLPASAVKPGEPRGEGLKYRYLVLCDPQCRTLSPTVLRKIQELVRAGVTLVGLPPQAAPGLTDRAATDAAVKRFVADVWGSSPAAQGVRKVGKGRVIWGRAMGEILSTDGIRPDVEFLAGGQSRNGAGVASGTRPAWIHRRNLDADIYFLANPLNQPVDLTVVLRATGKGLQLLDPLDGSARNLPEKSVTKDGCTAVPLHFEPEQALFVVVRSNNQPSSSRTGERNFPVTKTVMAAGGAWQVTFEAAWVKPLPPSVAPGSKVVAVTFDKLEDWSKRTEAGIKGYSGVATYRKNFDLPPGVQIPERGGTAELTSGFVLDLGMVKEMARVEVNGRDLGVAWCPPWRVKIPEGVLKASGNELVITVANTWNNRLCADNALPASERLTQIGHNLHAQAAANGFQSAGLLGPVTVLVSERAKAK